MVGWVIPGAGKGWRRGLRTERLMGLTVLAAEVGEKRGWDGKGTERSCRAAARQLRRKGCRRTLAPEGFAYWPQLRQAGLSPVAAGGMCAALAGPLALAALAERGKEPRTASVLLRGSGVDRDFFEAALFLCPKVRRLSLWAGAEGEALARYLQRTYGAPILTPGPGWRPDLTVDLSPLEGTGDLALWGERPELGGLSLTTAAALPDGPDRLSLLALLWETGRVRTGELEIITSQKAQMT